MKSAQISLSRDIHFPRPVLYKIVADYANYHALILPRPPFGQLRVLEGGVGAGTIIRFDMSLGPFTSRVEAKVMEEIPGFLLHEEDVKGTFKTSFKFEELEDRTRVTLSTEFFKRPKFLNSALVGMLKKKLLSVYSQELANLESLAKKLSPLV